MPVAEDDVQKHSVHTLVFRSLKRTHDMFVFDHATAPALDDKAELVKKKCKSRDEYGPVMHLPTQPESKPKPGLDLTVAATDNTTAATPSHALTDSIHVEGAHPYPGAPGVALTAETMANKKVISEEGRQQAVAAMSGNSEGQVAASVADIQKHAAHPDKYQPPTKSVVIYATDNKTALVPKKAPTMPKPSWHPPWKLMRVISGHHGWVRCIAVEPANEWFVTGAGDRVIKIWDLASGQLKLSLTGHVSTVRGLAVSKRQPYLFSCGEDKQVKCWDLEQNKVVRHYHGHLSAVYCLDVHPTLDILVTAGRDSTARVWDMRSKANIHTLAGHSNTVSDVKCQEYEPQVVTSSHDATVRLWDIVAGKTKATLTNHKKSVRSLVLHPTQYTFASASPDNIKQWKFPDGNFIQNLLGHNAIVNCVALNSDNVLVSGGDNGSLHFWDWKTGYNFQRYQAAAQPGSIDSEAGVFAATFDQSGARLLTTDADKTIKVYREDEAASEETHPINWKPEILKRKRF